MERVEQFNVLPLSVGKQILSPLTIVPNGEVGCIRNDALQHQVSQIPSNYHVSSYHVTHQLIGNAYSPSSFFALVGAFQIHYGVPNIFKRGLKLLQTILNH